MRQLLFTVALLSCTSADAYEFSSSAQITNVLELYTSEGCSSCPPADQWLSAWVEHPQLWQSIIPLAFHVDYWDYIGWKDRFASPEHALRQRLYRDTGSVRSVYTPGFVLNGKEWRGWYRSSDQITPLKATPGVLTIDLSEPQFEASFTPGTEAAAKDLSALKLNVALLGFGLRSSVKAGENDGRNLQHDFVVLASQRYRPQEKLGADAATRSLHWQGSLPEISALGDQAKRLAWVAWIAGPDQRPLQATGGWRPAQDQLSRLYSAGSPR